MRPLRQKMINDMKVHRFSPKTQECYVSAVAGFAKFYNESDDRISQEKIQAHLLYVLDERKVSWSTCNVILSGLKFFYTQTLGMDAIRFRLPSRKRQKHLPEILSADELERLFAPVCRQAGLRPRPNIEPS